MPRASRPTRAQIDLRAIHHNLRFVRKLVGPVPDIMPVVKANAYGHGIVEVASSLSRKGFTQFGVAIPEEGVLLRQSGIDTPIHVFTLADAAQAGLVVRYGLEPTVGSERSLVVLRSAAERARTTVDVHLKIESGMNRIGIRPSELVRVLRAIARSKRIRLKAVYTHFATSDEPGSRFADRQLRLFEDALEQMHRLGALPDVIHAANSGAILRKPGSYFTMVRPGIMMYGYSPTGPRDHATDLRPAMRLRSEIAQVKRIKAGESVSYGRQFRAKRPTVIGTVPIGYADGLFRTLSGKGSVLVGGTRRPIAGRVCMDQIMVDCGRMDVRPGTEVVIFGGQGGSFLSAWEQARLIGTIPYELTCAVSERVPREYRA